MFSALSTFVSIPHVGLQQEGKEFEQWRISQVKQIIVLESALKSALHGKCNRLRNCTKCGYVENIELQL